MTAAANEVSAERMDRLRAKFEDAFGAGEARLFSAPGRTEIGGNHTDHQHGHILAAAVDIDAAAAARPRSDRRIVICSDRYARVEVDLSTLEPSESERESSAGLIRGVAAYLNMHGYAVGGFSAYTDNLVPAGSGLSSSAAFEVLAGTILSGLYNAGNIPAIEIARAGQYAENNYYGKPSGLMDQAASAIGGVIAMDLRDPADPAVRRIDVDMDEFGHSLCVVSVGAGHESLNDEYASITGDMRAVAGVFGAETLREVEYGRFAESIPSLRDRVSGRAILRAMHFYADDLRAVREAEALERKEFGEFLRLVDESGMSSWRLLQNIYPAGSIEQPAALALEWCRRILAGEGACRIHGGGFGGTIQVFVPAARTKEFRREMERLTGEGSCRVLNIRAAGGVEI